MKSIGYFFLMLLIVFAIAHLDIALVIFFGLVVICSIGVAIMDKIEDFKINKQNKKASLK
jgi:hypothetical protein